MFLINAEISLRTNKYSSSKNIQGFIREITFLTHYDSLFNY